jgi:hypothetical protein
VSRETRAGAEGLGNHTSECRSRSLQYQAVERDNYPDGAMSECRTHDLDHDYRCSGERRMGVTDVSGRGEVLTAGIARSLPASKRTPALKPSRWMMRRLREERSPNTTTPCVMWIVGDE